MSWLSAFLTIFLASLVFVETKDSKCYSYTGELQDVGDALGTVPIVKIGEGLYFFAKNNKVNWYEASEICRRYNAHLASIETELEMQSLSEYLTREKFDSSMWVSGADLHKTKEFIWMGTGQPLEYTFWDVGQPHSNHTDNCIYLSEINDWKWHHYNCSHPLGYICEGKRQALKYQFQFQFD